jgi:hypothetical protein
MLKPKFVAPGTKDLKRNVLYLWKDKQEQYYVGELSKYLPSVVVLLPYCYGDSFTIDLDDMVGVAEIALD